MSEELCSVGIDVGTTTTQLVVSRLRVENQASGFAVPRLQITERALCYRSPVYVTPLLEGDRVDGTAIGEIVKREYEKAGITPETVDTGAIIITGETSRKENARAVLDGLSGYAGSFVVATAGPDLESVLAARGAGAVAHSADTGKRILHMDIGGGTTNLALIEEGEIVSTGCLNVGGRLIKFGEDGRVVYLSPVLKNLTDLQIGDVPEETRLQKVADCLVQTLEMAAGLREKTQIWEKLVTREAAHTEPVLPGAVISFSGGVADCIDTPQPNLRYGDIGPLLGKTIRASRLCQGNYMLGQQTIRATVIGAGCHSAQLSGSTVFCKDVPLPLKNLPVALLNRQEQYDPAAMKRKMALFDTRRVVLAIPGEVVPTYRHIEKIARAAAEAAGKEEILLCVERDMARAIGNCLMLLGAERCLCIDSVELQEGSFLDVGRPVGPALPVVVKTLVLPTVSNQNGNRGML